MPIINIREQDNTTSGVIAKGSDIVVIPGCSGKLSTATTPPTEVTYHLFSKLGDFKRDIGDAPVQDKADTTKVDSGYVMAKELLNAGLTIIYAAIPAEVVSGKAYLPEDMTSEITKIYGTDSELIDKGLYDIKFITSGGYEVAPTTMRDFASSRGDCVALIDYEADKALTDLPTEVGKLNSSYAAAFAPWATYDRSTIDSYEAYSELPAGDSEKKIGDSMVDPKNNTYYAGASFGYLLAYATSIQTNPNWLAIAGISRGKVPNLSKIDSPVSNTLANKLQPTEADSETSGYSVNTITKIGNYGNVIWGNRTTLQVKDGIVAMNSLHLRNLVNDVKKACYESAMMCMFEQDTDILWVNFKGKVSGLLDRMKSGYGISGYRFIRDTEHESANENGCVCAKVVLYPTFAVEKFEITVTLENDQVTVE